MVNILQDMLRPTERDTILDPAAGSGGFLIAFLRHIRHRVLAADRSPKAKARVMRAATEHLFGIDISVKLVRVAKTNMILNGDGHGGLAQGD